MIPALRAEWTKLRSLRSTWWLLLALAGGSTTTAAAVLATLSLDHCSSGGCDEDTVRLALAGVYTGQGAVAVLAALAVSAEYGTRTISSTLLACPRRSVVLVAKLAVVLALVLGAGTAGVLGSLAAGRLVLPANGFTAETGYPSLSVADGPTLRAAAGTVLYLLLLAVLAAGIAFAVRHTAAALVSTLGLILTGPMLAAFVTDPVWNARLLRSAPMTAGLAIQHTKRLDTLPIAPWPGLGVLALYAGTAVLIGAIVLHTRDA